MIRLSQEERLFFGMGEFCREEGLKGKHPSKRSLFT